MDDVKVTITNDPGEEFPKNSSLLLCNIFTKVNAIFSLQILLEFCNIREFPPSPHYPSNRDSRLDDEK